MTDPIYHRLATEMRDKLGSEAVVVISFNKWGNPTIAAAHDPAIDKTEMERIDSFYHQIQTLLWG